jgi:RNA polymerase sigma factor (sigma-70 family)
LEDSNGNGTEFADERTLVAGLLRRDDRAFGFLARELSRRFLSYLEREMDSREDVEEILNDAAYKVITRIGTFDLHRGSSFWSWVYKVIENQKIDRLRQTKRQTPADMISLEALGDQVWALREVAPCLLGSNAEEAAPSAQVVALGKALEQLRRRDRLILDLHFRLNLTDEEVARQIQTCADNVRKYRSRALGRLRKILEQFPEFRNCVEQHSLLGESRETGKPAIVRRERL